MLHKKSQVKVRNRILLYLEKNGLTQKQLAKRIGCTPETLNRWIKGKNHPNVKYIATMSKIFKCDIGDLYQREV